ncbi:MAG: tetratricopeptide repeat protein [Verrucomicrobiota bacterium]
MMSRHLSLWLALILPLVSCNGRQDRLDEADRLLRTAGMRHREGRYEDAVGYARRAFDDFFKLLGSDAAETIDCRGRLSEYLRQAGHVKEATEVSRTQVIICFRAYGERSISLQSARLHLAACLRMDKAYEEAEALCRKALKECTEDLGPDSPDAMSARQALTVVLSESGRYSEAIREGTILLELQRQRNMGETWDNVLATRTNLAADYVNQGLLEMGEKELRSILEVRIKRDGPNHPDTLGVESWLGNCLREQRRLNDSLPILRRVWEQSVKVLGPHHPNTLKSCFDLATIEFLNGNKHEALLLLRSTAELAMRHLGPQHSTTLAVQQALEMVK